MKLDDERWHKRLPNWVPYDKVTIEVVPRYKTSGLSGDEWRTSARVQFWFKGELIDEEYFGSMEYAMKRVASLYDEKSSPIHSRVIKLEGERCDMPSCSAPSVSVLAIKQEFSDCGQKLDASEVSRGKYRSFCKKHVIRGDCSREDSDDNYEVISGPGPREAEGFLEDVSPSSSIFVDAETGEVVGQS